MERKIVGHKTFHSPEQGFWHEPLYADEAEKCHKQWKADEARRQEQMPDEESAIVAFFDAWHRLKDFGWRDPVYCPKDGSEFLVIEAGSTGQHRCIYQGEWPSGSCWILADGDMCPTRPTMFKALAAVTAHPNDAEGRT